MTGYVYALLFVIVAVGTMYITPLNTDRHSIASESFRIIIHDLSHITNHIVKIFRTKSEGVGFVSISPIRDGKDVLLPECWYGGRTNQRSGTGVPKELSDPNAGALGLRFFLCHRVGGAAMNC